MKVFDNMLKFIKNIRIVKIREDEYTTMYAVYYLSEKIGIIEVRSDYSVYIEKIKSFLDLLR